MKKDYATKLETGGTMLKNPYKFIGPLDPVEDEPVCMPRSKEKNRVISGVMNGDYWTILGPRQIGKTTFLRQLMNELPAFHCIYIDFEVSPKTDESFYNWIIERIIDTIEADSHGEEDNKWKNFGPELNFLNFLEKFQPKQDKKIVFFFDDMEKAHCVRSFLHLWRKVFHERYHRQELKQYVVITAGKVDLGSLTIGETSPFNIARRLELTNLDEKESEKLVIEPLKKLHVKLDPKARETLFSSVSGHPQMLQHLCHILIEHALEESENKHITHETVENAIKRILIENDNLKSLEKEFKTNKILENLTRQILEGKEKDYIPYRDLSITGTGPIIPIGHHCAIRNKIYELVLKNLVDENSNFYTSTDKEAEYTTTIYFKEMPGTFASTEEEAHFLRNLFDVTSIRFQVKKDHVPLEAINLNRTEKLVFLYIAYRNHKARQAGFLPSMRKYHLSSVPKNNTKQEPEWTLFADAVNTESYLSKNSPEPDGTIRAAIFGIRKKLKNIGSEDLIPRQKPGGGEGYWLKGDVVFTGLDTLP
jgi:hypothetical protein